MATALGFGQVSPQQRQRFMAFNQPQQATILNQLQKTNPLAAASHNPVAISQAFRVMHAFASQRHTFAPAAAT